MNKQELAEKGRRAQAASDEFVNPALEACRAEYMEALTKLAANEPWRSDKIVKLSIATRVIDAVGAHLRAAISNGELASKEMRRAREIADLPAAKRRWLDLA